jgi:VanZ family protein
LASTQNTQTSSPGRFSRYAPLILWMGFIFFASTSEFSADNTTKVIRPLLLWVFPNLSEASLVVWHFVIRKLAHFSEYAILAALAARAFLKSSHHFLYRYWFGSSLALVATYALLDEYHQSFVPTRTASIYDSVIDITGGLAALVVVASWNRRREISRHPQIAQIRD